MRTKLVPITEARTRMRELVDRLDESSAVVFLRHSRPAAVLVSPERYDELVDRIEHLEAQLSVLHAQANPDEVEDWAGLRSEIASDEREPAAR